MFMDAGAGGPSSATTSPQGGGVCPSVCLSVRPPALAWPLARAPAACRPRPRPCPRPLGREPPAAPS